VVSITIFCGSKNWPLVVFKETGSGMIATFLVDWVKAVSQVKRKAKAIHSFIQ
jgi:hypothetical protein